MQSKSKLFKNILALLLLGLVFSSVSQRAEAQYNFSLLHSFNGYNNLSDGAYSSAGLTMDSLGNLYGTTTNGGAHGDGTVFKIDTHGNFSLLHSFNLSDTTDGYFPLASVTLDSQGNLYGATPYGGANDIVNGGDGTVFKIDIHGNFSLLHSFSSPDGAHPVGSVTLDSQGNIYGTTQYRGAYNAGSVFMIDALGNFSLLHTFNANDPLDGAYPNSSVTLDSHGNLYGTTGGGGAYDSVNGGDGTVFKIDTSDNFSLLHSFNGSDTSDGKEPFAAVTFDSQGNLYGTSQYGGAYNAGTVFKIDTLGSFSLLHSFNAYDPSDGAYPNAFVTLDSQGNLYGTAMDGGTYGNGTVFKIDTQGSFSLLHSFNRSDGTTLFSPVILDSKGNLYGTTESGGTYDQGTVFELANNVTTPTMSYTYHGFIHRPGSHTISQQVTITNTSGAALTGPFNQVVSALPSGITLNNRTGTTAFTHPGSPYLTVGSNSLAPGASITVTLSFNDPSLRYISYSPTFLAGNGTP